MRNSINEHGRKRKKQEKVASFTVSLFVDFFVEFDKYRMRSKFKEQSNDETTTEQARLRNTLSRFI